jgi:hypothetical protein
MTIMTQSAFRSPFARVALLTLALATAGSAAAQQPPVTYRLDWAPSEPSYAIFDMNNNGLVVGNVAGKGFIYDSLGVLGAPKTRHWLSEFMTIPPEWSFTCCTGINDMGVVVGQFRNGLLSTGYVVDLNTGVWRYLPQPPNCDWAYGDRVNNQGLVLAYFKTTSGVGYAYLHDLAGDETQFAVLSNPATGAPLENISHLNNLNNVGQVAGRVAEGAFRWTPGRPLEVINDPNLDTFWEMNDFGALCGYGYTYIRKNLRLHTACVYTNQLNWLNAGTQQTTA